MLLGGHLQGVTLADVAAQADVQARFLEEVVDQRGRGGLAVGAGDADFLRVVVARSEFDFGDDVRALAREFLDEWGRGGDAGAFDDLVGAENLRLAVAAFFEGDVPLAQHRRVVFPDVSVVGKEDVETFYFCEHRSAYAAFRSAQYYDFIHLFILFSI